MAIAVFGDATSSPIPLANLLLCRVSPDALHFTHLGPLPLQLRFELLVLLHEFSKWTTGKTSNLKEETKAQIASLLGCPGEALDRFLGGELSWDELKASCSLEAIDRLGKEEAATSEESFFKRIEQLTLVEALEALQAISQRLSALQADANSHRQQDMVELIEVLASWLNVDFLMQLGERVQTLLGLRLNALEKRMQELGWLESRPHQHNPLFRKLEKYRLEAGLSREQLAHQLHEKSGGQFDSHRATAIATGKYLPDNGEVLWLGGLLKNPQGQLYTHDELLALRAGELEFFRATRRPPRTTTEDARSQDPPSECDRDLQARGGNKIK